MFDCSDETNQRYEEQHNATCYQATHQSETCNYGNHTPIGCYTNQYEGDKLKIKKQILSIIILK